jgi:8-hydroxy-5-deazaflavin:NADPH oxidoreductase
MAGALGSRFGDAGHDVFVGARRVDRARALATEVGRETGYGTIEDAARFGELVLLAVKRAGIVDALNAARGPEGALAGKALLDCNNVGPDPAEGVTIADEIQRLAPGANVVKVFNCCHFQVWSMCPPTFDGRPLAVPYCGDDQQAKSRVADLIKQLGCTPLDIGALAKARHLEYLAAIVIGLLFDGADPTTVFNLVDAVPSPSPTTHLETASTHGEEALSSPAA